MTAPERKETQCPDCLSENAVPKEVAWDALTKVPRKTANDLQAALDRIAELEGALRGMIGGKTYVPGFGDYESEASRIARAVLAKGDG